MYSLAYSYIYWTRWCKSQHTLVFSYQSNTLKDILELLEFLFMIMSVICRCILYVYCYCYCCVIVLSSLHIFDIKYYLVYDLMNIFKDIPCVNAMMTAFIYNECYEKVLDLYKQ